MTAEQYEVSEKVLDLFIEARVESKGVYPTLKILFLKSVARYLNKKWEGCNGDYSHPSDRMKTLLSYFNDCNEIKIRNELISEVKKIKFEEHFKNRDILRDKHLQKVKDLIFGVCECTSETKKPVTVYDMFYIKDEEEEEEWRSCGPTVIGDRLHDDSKCKVEFAIRNKEGGHVIKYRVESLEGRENAVVSTEYLCERCGLSGDGLTTHCCGGRVPQHLAREIQQGKVDYILDTWLTYPKHSDTYDEVQRVSSEVISYFTQNRKLTPTENTILFEAMDYNLKERYKPTK